MKLADDLTTTLKNLLNNCNPVGNTLGCGSNQPIKDNPTNFNTLGDLITLALNLIVDVSFVLMLIMLIAGALQYIFAGGNKDRLAAARKRLTFAIIGFILVIVAFLLKDFAYSLFAPSSVNITNITSN